MYTSCVVPYPPTFIAAHETKSACFGNLHLCCALCVVSLSHTQNALCLRRKEFFLRVRIRNENSSFKRLEWMEEARQRTKMMMMMMISPPPPLLPSFLQPNWRRLALENQSADRRQPSTKQHKKNNFPSKIIKIDNGRRRCYYLSSSSRYSHPRSVASFVSPLFDDCVISGVWIHSTSQTSFISSPTSIIRLHGDFQIDSGRKAN